MVKKNKYKNAGQQGAGDGQGGSQPQQAHASQPQAAPSGNTPTGGGDHQGPQGGQPQQGGSQQQRGPKQRPQGGPHPQQGPQQQKGPQPQHQQGPQHQKGPHPQQGAYPHQQSSQAGHHQGPQGGQPQQGSSQQQRGPKQHLQGGPYPQQGPQQQKNPQPQHQQQGPSHHEGQQKQQGPIPQQREPQQQPQQQQQRPQKAASDASAYSMVPCEMQKGPGKLGRPVRIETNYLQLSIGKMVKTVYQYDVKFDPDMPKRLLPAIFECFRQKMFPQVFVAYDGRASAYSPVILKKMEPMVVDVIDPENNREKKYKVTMSETSNMAIDMSSLQSYQKKGLADKPLRAIQVVDVLLRSIFQGRCVPTGRSLFCRPDKPLDLGDNYELWTGLFQSAILGDQVLLNVDVVHKAFPSPINVVQAMRSFRGVNLAQGLDRRLQEELATYLRGLRITYRPPFSAGTMRTYKFTGLGRSADEQMFKDENGKSMSVQAYFAGRGYKIQYPKLPLLSVGNTIKSIFLPAELCEITANQVSNKKCTEFMTRNMIRAAATSTDVRRDKIFALLNKFDHNSCPGVRSFGLEVGKNFIEIPARILDSPVLQYGDKTIKPNNGDWMRDTNTFLRPAPVIDNWAILILDRFTEPYSCKKFADLLCKVAVQQKMNMVNNPIIDKCDPRDLDNKMKEFAARNMTVVFVIVSGAGGNDYSKTKQSAEIKFGVLTQCIKGNTIKNKGEDLSTLKNILLKVNTKLNGMNHKIADVSKSIVMKAPFMFIGADVTHPSPDQNDIPSVVGVAASRDIHGFQYNMYWRLQDARQEEISELQDIVVAQLEVFKKLHNRLPMKILYYRDGVSEGQFAKVLSLELQAIRNACFQVGGGETKIAVTFIVVQKRHHTRLFPGKSKIGDRKNNNVPPGTIVDTTITYPKEHQFFLVSHQSVQGVAKPTKYNVLVDDSKLSNDDLQALTYHLCYLFTRCNRSVSYPAPTYYAHLAAYRGRVYIDGFPKVNMLQLKKEFLARTVKPAIIEDRPMYFV